MLSGVPVHRSLESKLEGSSVNRWRKEEKGCASRRVKLELLHERNGRR